MPSVTFSLTSSDRLLPRRAMLWHANLTTNGVLQPNCSLCTSPVEQALLLDIALTSESSFPGTWDITVTLNITNNTGASVTVDTNNVTTGSGTIVWNAPTSITLADGASGQLIGTINVGAGVHDFSGTVGDSSGPVTSNTDSESITV
jgi:hypothetical protein